jgi:hypothetical protein
MSRDSLWALAAAAIAALSFAAALRWTRWRTSSLSRRRAKRGFAGQAAAAKLLGGAGYEVVEANPRVPWVTLQDGEPHTVELRGDYLVSRRGQLYLAEVKTGDAADLLGNSATRRQLLEYQLAFGADGILLVCPEQKTIHAVEFPGLETEAAPPSLAGVLWLVAGAALGAAGSLMLLR